MFIIVSVATAVGGTSTKNGVIMHVNVLCIMYHCRVHLHWYEWLSFLMLYSSLVDSDTPSQLLTGRQEDWELSQSQSERSSRFQLPRSESPECCFPVSVAAPR